jgi:endonuclease IV
VSRAPIEGPRVATRSTASLSMDNMLLQAPQEHHHSQNYHYPIPDVILVTPDLFLGVHASLSARETLESVLRSDLLASCNTIQVFLGSPQSLSAVRRLTDADARACAKLAKDYGWRIMVHHPYRSNFVRRSCSPSLARLRTEVAELRRVVEKGRGVVVLHPGSACALLEEGDDAEPAPAGEEPAERKKRLAALSRKKVYTPAERAEALSRIVANLSNLGADLLGYVAVENAAGEKGKLCSTLAELRVVARALPTIRFCIDTAHASGAGYSLTTRAEMRAFLAELDAAVGLDRVACWHLNDSLVPRGARRDAHARLCRGTIWSDDASGLCELLRVAASLGTPLVGEGSIDAFTDVPMLRDLLAGERP